MLKNIGDCEGCGKTLAAYRLNYDPPTGLRVCDACGALCLHNRWDRSAGYWVCASCAREARRQRMEALYD